MELTDRKQLIYTTGPIMARLTREEQQHFEAKPGRGYQKANLLRAVCALYLTVSCVGLLSGCCSLPGPNRKASAPSFKVAVNSKLKPSSEPLPRFPDGAPRPLATLTDKSGKQTDFVENELMIEFATQNELSAFLAKWHGTVLATDRPTMVGIAANPTYLIRVQTKRADLSKLTRNLSGLNPNGGSAISVGTRAARRLIAIGAETAMTGKHVGINYLTTSAGFQDRQLAEAPTSANTLTSYDGWTIENWNPNPFQWIYMKTGGNLDIGVAAAWRVLEQVGALDNKVKIAVIDGGFGGGDDFPSPYESNKASLAALDPTGPNEVSCNGSPCPWHGWNVVNACMGQVNNGIGAAGPAGPVGKLLAIRRSADVFSNIQAITTALFSGANIINMSFAARVPALLSWSVLPFDLATLRAQGAGKLLVASAGNDGHDINEEDCFILCWEEAWWTPCENGGVACVGAMDTWGPYRRGSSNYGGDELDIWGPGSVWVGGDYGDNSPHEFRGTSAASPFIAGVAALIWAANPGLSNDGVERVMYETAHQGQAAGHVERWPNAYAAVIRALGGTPPEINIDVRWEASVQMFGACNPYYQFTATVVDPDHGPPTVTWTSNIDNVVGNGTSFSRMLSDGTHHITATAVDGIGLTNRSNEIVLQVRNPTSANAPRPTVDIISLANHQTFAANQNITFEAGGLDPATAGALIAANVRWVSSKDGELGSGQRIFRMLSPGAHYIFVYYTGKCGGTADDLRLIQVTATVADAPPNMTITMPATNDLLLSTVTGEACLRVGGFGFDEEDRDFVFDWWETNRNDLQWKVLSFDQNTTVCLKLAANAVSTVHEIRLRGTDRTGNSAYSAPLRVTVLPGPR
jgi:serine protease